MMPVDQKTSLVKMFAPRESAVLLLIDADSQ